MNRSVRKRRWGMLTGIMLVATSCAATAPIDAAGEAQADMGEAAEHNIDAEGGVPEGAKPGPTEGASEPAADDTASTSGRPSGGTPEPRAPDDNDAAKDPDAPSSADSPIEPFDVPAGGVSVRLIDPGQEPLQLLRFDISSSCSEITTLTQVQDIRQTISGDPQPSRGPTGTVVSVQTTTTPNGNTFDVRVEVIDAMSSPDTPPAVAAMLDRDLGALIGLTTFATIDERGLQMPGTARIEGTEGLGPVGGVLDGLVNVQNPFPIEPVGVGARWETTSVLEASGLEVANISETELVSRDGTTVVLAVRGSQIADPSGSMQVGSATAEILRWDISVEGSTTLDLTSFNPIGSAVKTSGFQEFDAGIMTLEQELAMEMSMTSEPGPGCSGAANLRP